MLEIKHPASWLQADIKELFDFVKQVDGSLNEMQMAAQVLQDFGTKHAHKPMLKGGSSFDYDSFSDMKKVLDGRLRMEKPDLDIILGSVPEKTSPDFGSTVQNRIEFASKYKYPKDVITSESDRFK